MIKGASRHCDRSYARCAVPLLALHATRCLLAGVALHGPQAWLLKPLAHAAPRLSTQTRCFGIPPTTPSWPPATTPLDRRARHCASVSCRRCAGPRFDGGCSGIPTPQLMACSLRGRLVKPCRPCGLAACNLPCACQQRANADGASAAVHPAPSATPACASADSFAPADACCVQGLGLSVDPRKPLVVVVSRLVPQASPSALAPCGPFVLRLALQTVVGQGLPGRRTLAGSPGG